MSDAHGGYLVTESDGTTHLPTRKNGKLDHGLMGAAWAALHGGYRGNKYEGPGKAEAIAKLKRLYGEEKMDLPGVQNRGSRLVVCNRLVNSRPGWIHIVPRGELYNPEADLTQVFDEAAHDSIMNRLEAEKTDPNWPGIYVGREHFIYNAEKDSQALGWLKDFDRNADGIWAKENDLNEIGKTAIRNREYKFTSLVADRGDLQKVAEGKYRVLAIETVGLTNMPVGRELLAPIANRSGHGPDATNFAGTTPADNQKQTQRNKMKDVLTELGLSAEASEQTALGAVIKLKNRVAELEPLPGEITKLKNRLEKLDGANVDALLKGHGITDEKVMNRMRPLIAKIETPEERTQFLTDCNFKPVEPPKAGAAQTKLFNRDGKAPGGEKTGTETDDKAEKELAGKIMNRAREIMKETKNLSLATAVTMAQRELQMA